MMSSKLLKEEVPSVRLVREQYENGQLAVYLHSVRGEQIAELSIKNDNVELSKNEIILKDYSENSFIHDELVNKGIFIPTERFILVGNHLCPVCKVSV